MVLTTISGFGGGHTHYDTTTTRVSDDCYCRDASEVYFAVATSLKSKGSDIALERVYEAWLELLLVDG